MSGQADIVKAFAPLFAAGFAIQQVITLADSLLSAVGIGALGDWKKFLLKLLSVGIAVFLVSQGRLLVLEPLGYAGHELINHFAAVMVIAGGTEGVNSVVKFLGYAKEDKKSTAAVNTENARSNAKPAFEQVG